MKSCCDLYLCSDVRTGVEDAHSQRTLALRKPLGDGLNGGGKVAGFSDAEEETRNAEFKRGIGQGVAHRGEAPYRHDENAVDACADLIDHVSGDEQTDGVSSLKCVDYVAIVYFCKADGVLEGWLPPRNDLAIHIIDRSREEEHSADDPAHMSETWAGEAASFLLRFGRDWAHACSERGF